MDELLRTTYTCCRRLIAAKSAHTVTNSKPILDYTIYSSDFIVKDSVSFTQRGLDQCPSHEQTSILAIFRGTFREDFTENVRYLLNFEIVQVLTFIHTKKSLNVWNLNRNYVTVILVPIKRNIFTNMKISKVIEHVTFGRTHFLLASLHLPASADAVGCMRILMSVMPRLLSA